MDYHRHTIRLRKDTYSHPGIYFVTIGSIKHVCIFGEIINNCFLINNLGKIVLDNYQKLSQRFKNIDVGLIQLMPNHIHCLIRIVKQENDEVMGRGNRAPTPITLGKIIAYWKYNVTKEINCRGGVAPPLFKNNWNHWLEGKIFQRNYFERIVRDNDELERIKKYIKLNPLIWNRDRNNPKNIKKVI
jgi:REP element-mobilizing transposase RayT